MAKKLAKPPTPLPSELFGNKAAESTKNKTTFCSWVVIVFTYHIPAHLCAHIVHISNPFLRAPTIWPQIHQGVHPGQGIDPYKMLSVLPVSSDARLGGTKFRKSPFCRVWKIKATMLFVPACIMQPLNNQTAEEFTRDRLKITFVCTGTTFLFLFLSLHRTESTRRWSVMADS